MIGIYGDIGIFEEILSKNNLNYVILSEESEFDTFDSLILVGEKTLPVGLRKKVDRYIKTGKPVYAEMITSISDLLTVSKSKDSMLRCYDIQSKEIMSLPLMSFRELFTEIDIEVEVLWAFTSEHVHRQSMKKECKNHSEYAIFKRENIYYSCIPLSRYDEFNMIPYESVVKIFKLILARLGFDNLKLTLPRQNFNEPKVWKENVLKWFKNNEMLILNGKLGVHEGFASSLSLEGKKPMNKVVRNDCTAETAFMYYLLGDQEKYKNLIGYSFDSFISQEGFVRWSDEAYMSMYPDDTARALIPVLMKNLFYSRDNEELEMVAKVCGFLAGFANESGIFPTRLEERLNGDYVVSQDYKLSAHYNGYACALMILSGKVLDNIEWINIGIKGIDSLLNAYPFTIREQSETQELSRLLLPLAIKVWVNKEEKDVELLRSLFDKLMKFKVDGGLIQEWDTGYQAVMRYENGTGESSLLSVNGDKVADLLYTNNWLPLSYAWMYLACGSNIYRDAFVEISEKLKSMQIRSENDQIDGAWMRGYDFELGQYFGSPADSGWGPYCIETGWTMSVITYGILWGEKILYEKSEM